MKTCSTEEIIAIARELWPYSTIRVPVNKPTEIQLEISEMYEAPGLSFNQLRILGEKLGTMNIDNVADINIHGCETCDWGSSYGFTLYIKPEDKE